MLMFHALLQKSLFSFIDCYKVSTNKGESKLFVGRPILLNGMIKRVAKLLFFADQLQNFAVSKSLFSWRLILFKLDFWACGR